MTIDERRVAGDALQLAGLVRDHGPDTLHRVLDAWGPDHIRAVCIALAAAVDLDRTPQELWGWLGPVDNRLRVTVDKGRLFNRLDPHAMSAQEVNDARPSNSMQRANRQRKRAERGAA